MILIDHPTKRQGKEAAYSHMVADNLRELHVFAERMEIKRCWYENKKGKHPHYDVVQRQFSKAIENGAKLVTSREIVNFLKEHYGN